MTLTDDNGTLSFVCTNSPDDIVLPTDLTEALQQLSDHERQLEASSMSDNTLRAYRSDLLGFKAWCERCGLEHVPASGTTVALYAAHLHKVGRRTSTIERAVSAISQAHRAAGLPNPTAAERVRRVMSGIRRVAGTHKVGKDPISLEELRSMVASCPEDLTGLRDRSILLLGFVGAFRRSELVALDVGDLDAGERGVLVTVRRSKTDQTGEGMVKVIPYSVDPSCCPVRALRGWFEASAIQSGAVFRSIDRWGRLSTGGMGAAAVAGIVKRAASRVGIDPIRVAGHSLRSGFATSAILVGKAEADVMRQTGHRSVTVFRGYVRVADAWRRNPAKGML